MTKPAIVTLLVLAVLFVGMAAMLSDTKVVRDGMGDPAINSPLTLNEDLTWSAGGFSGTWAYLGDTVDLLLFKTILPNGEYELWYAARISGTWIYELGGTYPFIGLGGPPYSFNMMD